MKRIRVSRNGAVVSETEVDRELVVGRSERADIRVDDSEVSSRHLRVRPRGADVVVADLGSTNGTYRDDGSRLAPETDVVLSRGQKLTLGSAVVELVEMAAADAESSDAFGGEKTVAVGGGEMQSALINLAKFRAAAPRLVIAAQHDRRTVAILEMECVIGRDPSEAQVEVRHASVSSRHAVLSFEGGSFRLRDLDTSNGTFVDGNRIEGATAIQPETAVTFGTVDCLFSCRPPESDGASELAEALVAHAVAMRKATHVEARAVLDEHRQSGRPLGELFVERGVLTPRVWVDLWRQRDVIQTLGRVPGGRSGANRTVFLVVLVLAVVAAAVFVALR